MGLDASKVDSLVVAKEPCAPGTAGNAEDTQAYQDKQDNVHDVDLQKAERAVLVRGLVVICVWSSSCVQVCASWHFDSDLLQDRLVHKGTYPNLGDSWSSVAEEVECLALQFSSLRGRSHCPAQSASGVCNTHNVMRWLS